MHVPEYTTDFIQRICEWLIKFSNHLPYKATNREWLLPTPLAKWITILTGWLIRVRSQQPSAQLSMDEQPGTVGSLVPDRFIPVHMDYRLRCLC